ncbi:hypothetical protein [Gordonia lacunae]|nr:hypothetical protein [Gordonia lacunae]
MADDDSASSEFATEFSRYLDENPSERERLHESLQVFAQNALRISSGLESTIATFAKASAQWVEQWQAATHELLPAFAKIGEMLDRALPSNMPRNPSPALEALEEVLETDGIPIIHVPRAEIVREILYATSFDDRLKIIETRQSDIAEDCALALADKDFASLAGQAPLAKRAVEAFRDGHYESAQALSIAVCDTYLKSYLFTKTGYKKMAKEVKLKEDDEAPAAFAFNFLYALAPVASFLTEWHPGDEPLTKLSRHVSIHFASTDHFSQVHATLSLMLVTSMTVAIDWAERFVK